MKITKEEKHLHQFLKMVYTIFSKTTGRTLLFGHNQRLYFKTSSHGGIFNLKTELLANTYQFTNTFYELKQLPNGSYELQAYIANDIIASSEKITMLEYLNTCESSNHFEMELEKNDRFKLAKINSKTGMWIADEDIKYLKNFNDVEIISVYGENALVARSTELYDDGRTKVIINLIFNVDIDVDEKSIQERMPIPIVTNEMRKAFDNRNVVTVSEESIEDELESLLNETIEELEESRVQVEVDPMGE